MRNGRLEVREKTALQRRGADGVLGDEPGRTGAVCADQGTSGPAVLSDDALQRSGIVAMDLLHVLRIVAVQATLGEEPAAGIGIALL